jgi:arginine N-succinyltransferase
MILVRPATLDDLDPLQQLAQSAGAGLTTLPDDRELLRKRIAKSVRSMENIPDRPGGESYLLVMEDMTKNRVIGASGIVSKVGGFEPFYAYRVEIQSFDCAPLNVHKKIRVLHLVRDHDGPAEVGSLFLSPDYRKKDHGRFLQLVRFLFVAEHPEAFEPLVVSELRGVIDESGRSAFWDAVGRHFFEIDFPKADHLSVVNKKFIADLMPTYPIYVPLLPAGAQTVIGQVHDSSKPALKNLEAEGFRFNGMVDIFDAGPCVSCQRDDIRTVRQSRVATVEQIGEEFADSATHMICPSGGAFRACMGSVQILSPDAIQLSEATASALKIARGARVRFAPLKPAPQQPHRQETVARDGEDIS